MIFDKRHLRWWWQRRRWGFDERELWNLDNTIREFVFPRLEKFRESYSCGVPMELTEEEWLAKLDDMLWALSEPSWNILETPEGRARRAKGIETFGEYFFALWL